MTDFSAQPLTAKSGAILQVRYLPTQGAPRAIVQINHGAAEHSGRYLPFAKRLSDAGFHVAAHDHRGHGDTVVPGAPPHTFGGKHGWDQLVADIGDVKAHITSIYPGLKHIMLGHSMGSIAAFDFALRHPAEVDALALLGPVLQKNPAMPVLRALLGIEGLFKSEGATSALFQSLAWDPLNKPYKNGRTDYDWLSRYEAEVDAYIADPNCGWPPPMNFSQQMAKGLAGTFNDARLKRLPTDLPVLLMSGSEDTSTNFGKSVPELEQRLTKAGLSDVSARLFEGYRHELHNEVGRDKVFDTLIAWCERVSA